jgi:hypothetical protein
MAMASIRGRKEALWIELSMLPSWALPHDFESLIALTLEGAQNGSLAHRYLLFVASG